MTPEQRAEHAARLLNDPLMKEALESLELEIIAQWDVCPVRDVEARETLWRFYKTAKKFQSVFIGAIQSGKIAALQDEKTLKEKALNMVRR